MNKILLQVLAICFCHINMVTAQLSGDMKEWTGSSCLKLSDFKGKVPANALNKEGSYLATAFVLYPETEDGKTKVQIKAICYPTKSWLKESGSKDQLFLHSQVYFNMKEAYARLFRKKMEALPQTQEEASKLLDQIEKQHEEMQLKYTNESEHGRKKDVILAWQKKIQSKLDALENYKG